MNYKGVIIEESLGDKKVLKNVKILSTRTEKITPRHNTPWVRQWTLHNIEISEKRGDRVADLLSQSFDPTHPQWYIDYKNDRFHFIVFNGQVFKVDISKPEQYKDARDYGISIGIPEHQLNFAPK